MVTMFKPKPQLMRSVAKPDNVSTKELAEARPVYIDGLPEGGGEATPTAWADVTGKPTTFPPATHTHTVANVTGLQDIIDDLEQRVAALEIAAG